jgi:VWFA-related protein
MLVCFGYGQQQETALHGQTPAIQVRVNMVTLPVVVTARDGRRILDLQREDFEIFEDKVHQEIAGFSTTEEPISVAVALDISGSMHHKLNMLKDEAIHFVERLHPQDQVAVITFADEVTLLEDFSPDRTLATEAIRRIRAGGATCLYETVYLALEQLLKPVRQRKALVLFTDGVDTASRQASRKQTLNMAKETEASINTIYFNTEKDFSQAAGGVPGPNPFPYPYPPVSAGGGYPGGPSIFVDYTDGRHYLSDLSRNSGGLFYNAMKSEDLGKAFEQIAGELASQYSLSYYPTNTNQDGKFHNVKVKVNRPGSVVRTRKGYCSREAEDRSR